MDIKEDPIFRELGLLRKTPRPRASSPIRTTEEENRLFEAFGKFHAENPNVYKLFKRFTREALDRGFKNFSVSSIIERIRWETSIKTADDSFKINNNHRAYYARMWMEDNPKHEGFFRTRSVQGTEGVPV